VEDRDRVRCVRVILAREVVHRQARRDRRCC
jgi:hypothetical protein